MLLLLLLRPTLPHALASLRYCIDYTSVSSRGTNRYATTVFIGGGKLYTLTVQAPADAWAGVASVAGGIAESFRVVA